MKIKNILSVLLCGVFILGFACWCFFGPKADYSESERRTLAKLKPTQRMHSPFGMHSAA